MKSITFILFLLVVATNVNGEARDELTPPGMRLPPRVRLPPIVNEQSDSSIGNSSSSSASASSSSSSESSESSSSADASLISAAASSSSSSDSSASSSSDSASDSSSAPASSGTSELGYLRKFHLFLESASRQERANKCPEGKYSKGEECLPCSLCGPDLYVREACRSDSDTFCDWCLNMKALKNKDFSIKCFATAKIHKEFEQLLHRPHSQVLQEQEMEVVFAEKDPPPYISYTSIREPFNISKVSAQSAWKLEMLVEACFYLLLIVLIFAVIRFLSKSKPHYRTITVNPPVFNDTDTNNIIRAAQQIRNKMGKNGNYSHLEEFI